MSWILEHGSSQNTFGGFSSSDLLAYLLVRRRYALGADSLHFLGSLLFGYAFPAALAALGAFVVGPFVAALRAFHTSRIIVKVALSLDSAHCGPARHARVRNLRHR
jgi:hypothetical protein